MLRFQNLLDRRLWWATVAGLVVVIGILTLTPSDGGVSPSSSFCLICGERGLADAILNVIMFSPLGLACFAATRSKSFAIIFSAAYSIAIEITQIFMTSRDGNLGDLVFNTTGAIIGCTIAATAPAWLSPARRAVMSSLSIALALSVLTFAALLHKPHLPSTTYFGQWTPQMDHLEWYRGRVLDARIDGLALPSTRLADADTVRRLIRNNAMVAVHVVAGPPVQGLSSIFNIADDFPNSIRFMGLDGKDAFFRFRTWSSVFRLDEPAIRIANAFAPIAPGDTFTYSVTPRGDEFCIRVGASATCDAGFRLADWWGVLHAARGISMPTRRIVGFASLALLFLPAGFFARTVRAVTAASFTIVAGLVVIPMVSPLLPLTWLDLSAALSGLGIGHFIGRRLPY